MKRVILLLVCTLVVVQTHAQQTLFRKVKASFRHLTENHKDTFQLDDGPYERPFVNTGKTTPQLVIAGEESAQVDSVYPFDISIYQQIVAVKAGDSSEQDITVLYSSERPYVGVLIDNKANGARYQYFADFVHASRLSMTAINSVGSGEKGKLDLEAVSPVYPGEADYLERLHKTGRTAEIAGILCEEYAFDAGTLADTSGTAILVSAHTWLPAKLHELFGGYIHIPEPYRQQLSEKEVSPLAMPLAAELLYSDGTVVSTSTTTIILAEPRNVRTADILIPVKRHS
ncbi:hypothetical protein [Chitinophaga sp. sic0106]|uniref:hypothetical protein n=1 Tax=Chitinophaga sp. sic0106 TaxID=2854785 RepID=UPI001C437416|nr:hypothetical protein [Chitinophaga sp. sic0106]MBV7532205.1 hypothetical protein [Chitinophaga sp. sic0106]